MVNSKDMDVIQSDKEVVKFLENYHDNISQALLQSFTI
jgi:hypothetical protein